MQVQLFGERLRAICGELGGHRDRCVAFLCDQLARFDLEGGGELLDPRNGELAGAGFEAADGDRGGGRGAQRGDFGQREAARFADFPEAAHHFTYSGKLLSYRMTNMAIRFLCREESCHGGCN